VSEPRAAERLLTHPRIRAATVERRLPGQVTLRVEERRPVAVLLGSQPLLVAADGVVFRPGEGEGMADLPYVTGLAGEDPFSAASTERLRRAAHVVDLWQAQTHLPPISEVRSESDQLIVFTVGTPLAVRFGLRASTDDLVRLSTLLDLWRGREAQMSTIDLSLPGEAVVGLRGGKRPSHGRSSTT
jgi:cell division septal protein FtsQ